MKQGKSYTQVLCLEGCVSVLLGFAVVANLVEQMQVAVTVESEGRSQRRMVWRPVLMLHGRIFTAREISEMRMYVLGHVTSRGGSRFLNSHTIEVSDTVSATLRALLWNVESICQPTQTSRWQSRSDPSIEDPGFGRRLDVQFRWG